MWTKIPHCSVTTSSGWLSFEEAIHKFKNCYADGIGFVFCEDDGLVGIDLDNVLNDDGSPDELAQPITSSANTYTELSPSRRGLHLYIKAQIPKGKKGRRIEIYTEKRFFTVTGHIPTFCERADVQNNQALADELYQYLTSREKAESLISPIIKRKSRFPSKSDREIINYIFSSSKDKKFQDLYNGEWQKYSFPSQSEADLSFFTKLMYWCQGDEQQAERVFKQSGLYRDKWERYDYKQRIIKKASKYYGN